MLDTWWIKSVRWLLALASIAGIVVGAFYFGQWLVVQFDGSCGEGNVIGGSCVETWHTRAVEIGIYAAVVLGAIGLSIIPAWIAPTLKRSLAVLILVLFSVALLAPYIMLGWADLVLPSLVGILVMIVGTLITMRINRVT